MPPSQRRGLIRHKVGFSSFLQGIVQMKLPSALASCVGWHLYRKDKNREFKEFKELSDTPRFSAKLLKLLILPNLSLNSLKSLRCGVRQNMPRDSHSEQKQTDLRPEPRIDHCHDAVAQCKPHHTHRHDLHTQRNSAMFPEITDICTQAGMIQQPLIQSR